MKNIIILLFLLIMISCKSQSPIYTLGQSPINKPTNSYLKDTNNILNKFAGTWIYNQSGKTFTVFLQKLEMTKLINYYVDELNGGYKYVDGSNIIINTLNNSTQDSKLSGFTLWEGDSNKVTLFFYDPERPRMGARVTLTYSNVNGVEKLHWDLRLTGYRASRDPNMNPATDFRVPTNVVLVKQ